MQICSSAARAVASSERASRIRLQRVVAKPFIRPARAGRAAAYATVATGSTDAEQRGAGIGGKACPYVEATWRVLGLVQRVEPLLPADPGFAGRNACEIRCYLPKTTVVLVIG